MIPARDATASLSIISFDLFYHQIIIIFKFFTDKNEVEGKH